MTPHHHVPPVLVLDAFGSGLGLIRGAVTARLLAEPGWPENRTRGLEALYEAPFASRRMSAAAASSHVVVLDPFSAGLAVARRWTAAGGAVTMIADDRRAETRARGLRALHVAPFGEAWVEFLLRIAAAAPDAVLIPASDRACALLLDCAERLPPSLRLFERGSHAHRVLMDKDTAEAVARQAGVNVPFSQRVASLEELQHHGASAPWPCVIKPVVAHTWRAAFGDERVFRVDDIAEAERRAREPLRMGIPLLLSQYIPGGDDAVEEAILLRAADGSFPLHFGVRKLRQFPAGFGQTALGESRPLPESTALAKRVLDHAAFVGVAGIETKRDVHTGERYFLEANVRVPAQWGLGDVSGADATRRLVAVLSGTPLDVLGPPPPPREGVLFVAPEKDLPLLRDRWRRTSLSRRPALLTRHLSAYARATERGLLNLRDPAPLATWLGAAARRRVPGGARRRSP